MADVILGGGESLRYTDEGFFGTRRLPHSITLPPVAHIDRIKTIDIVPMKQFGTDRTFLLRMLSALFVSGRCMRQIGCKIRLYLSSAFFKYKIVNKNII